VNTEIRFDYPPRYNHNPPKLTYRWFCLMRLVADHRGWEQSPRVSFTTWRCIIHINASVWMSCNLSQQRRRRWPGNFFLALKNHALAKMTTATLDDGRRGFDPGGPSSSGNNCLSSFWKVIRWRSPRRTRFWPDDAIDKGGEAICVFARCLKGTMTKAMVRRSMEILEWIEN